MKEEKMLKVGKFVPGNEEDGIPDVIEREHYGQGMIVKDEEAFKNRPDDVCYIPELSDSLYTRKCFVELCDSNEEMAEELFECCDWQHPESLMEDWIVNGEWERCERCGRLFDCAVADACPNCGNPVLSEEPWYTERWHEEDLVGAMEQAGVAITRTNLDTMKKACVDIFADKSARNEMLADKARELFEEVWTCR